MSNQIELLQAIGRVRRAMPRNPDVMAICDALEKTMVARLNIVEVIADDIAVVAKDDDKAPAKFAMRARRAKERVEKKVK